MVTPEKLHIPRQIGEVTTDWFRAALGEPVDNSRILQVINGTATKLHVELSYAGSRPTETVWVKTGFEEHSHRIGQESVYAGEIYYYQKLAGAYDTRTPDCLYAAHEPDTGNSVVVLRDLLDLGARFTDPVQGLTPEVTREGLRAIAAYQASSWMDSALAADDYLSGGGSWITGDVIGWLYSPDNWALQSTQPRFEALPRRLRDRSLLRDTHRTLQQEWWAANPFCLSHGDAHVGQTYVLPDGEVRFLDWQCVMKAHWAHDVSYFLISSLPIEDRRAHERELLRVYLADLAGRGVAVPDFATAWEGYRANAFHGIGWALCKVEMQGEDICTAIAERFAAAVVDLDSVDAVHRR